MDRIDAMSFLYQSLFAVPSTIADGFMAEPLGDVPTEAPSGAEVEHVVMCKLP